jgi:hypothetical protein
MLRMLAPGDRGLKAWVVWSLRSQSRSSACGRDPWFGWCDVVLRKGMLMVMLVDVTGSYCWIEIAFLVMIRADDNRHTWEEATSLYRRAIALASRSPVRHFEILELMAAYFQ